jgi:anti-sigma factor RsiW
MKISRDVVKDLLPLYAAGEASADTRVLVEEFLRDDPTLAALVEAARRQPQALGASPAAKAGTAEAARVGLRRTRRLIAWRTWLLAAAIVFTLLPGSVAISGQGVTWLMWRDNRPAAELSLIMAVQAWIGFFWCRRRLRVTGL